MSELKDALASLEVLEPKEHGSLRVFGLRWQEISEGPRYCTLD